MLKGSIQAKRFWRARLLSLLLLLCLATTAFALDPNKSLSEFGIQVWLTENGLPQNTVQAITQTQDGYLWIGTQEGLARFNSLSFVVFDKDSTPQMKSNDVRALLEEQSGALLIGTSYGLVKFKDGAFSSFTLKGEPLRIIPFSVSSISKLLWYGIISQYTFASRTARAMSCVYWLPKSRMRIFSVIICESVETWRPV